jgi:hypothetical protein
VQIDWMALLVVGLVSIGASVVFVALLAAGIRSVITAKASAARGGSSAAILSLGYGLLALAGLTVLFGLYLIVPQFH